MDFKYVANFPLEELRVRENKDGTMPTIEGVAVKWGSLSEDLGGWRERFIQGAFRDSLGVDDVRVVWQHDTAKVFGRMRKNTAEIWEDDVGLRFSAEPPDAQWARDAIEAIRREDVSQNSFRFWIEDRDTDMQFLEERGQLVREVLKARLVEVGPQTLPAYPDTEVVARTLDEAREAGFDAPVMINGVPFAVPPPDERSYGHPDTLRRRLRRKMKHVLT